MKDSFDLVMTMGDGRIRPFVDVVKLVQAPLFREALDHAIGHHAKHGDSRLIGELFSRFNRGGTRRLLVGYIRTHAGLDVSTEGGHVKLVKVHDVGDAVPPPKRAKKPAPAIVVTVKKKRKTPKRVDMMAPWIRMPGNYGSKR